MSGQGFPFQADALALARWDYCQIPSAVPELSDPLSCSLRTRQCGSHIAATGDRRWMDRASAELMRRQEPAVVTGWSDSNNPGCIDVDAPRGVCNLMSSGRYGPALWAAVGRSRAMSANDSVLLSQTGRQPSDNNITAEPEGGNEQQQITPIVFGSLPWLVQHYR